MLAKETSVSNKFDLPEEVLTILPSDPFEQLDIARKITSIALATRVSKLESESSHLRSQLTEKEDQLTELQSQIDSLDASLNETLDKLAHADEEKERLLKENASLSVTVKKLNRDVSKLEIFRKTLVQSLQEEEDTAGGVSQVLKKHIQNNPSVSSGSSIGVNGSHMACITLRVRICVVSAEEVAALPPSKLSSVQSQFSDTGNSFREDGGSAESDGYRHGTSQGPLLASYSSTPRLTPPVSPPSLSAAGSPTRRSKPGSPRRHSISFANSRGVFDERSSGFSSIPSSQHGSLSSSFDMGSQTDVYTLNFVLKLVNGLVKTNLNAFFAEGRTRVDGKEFFRQVRSRLSYEQFGAFLANVKELNSHKQNREETLRKADEIFGPDNKDLYVVFEGLITRNVH
ncbi:hypothetical protein IFM89_000918 [Coptis chinensis]|uniref:At4g15545-like C-terminal domain-containing protein n=1 Tax=Coptis chinensis TaxID=261450 RepID=A0A835IMG2_9MAGN|nr:hypothetical protein IFM89_000918 [Coptis chinensis]